MQVLRAPLNVWDKDSIRPGPVGSVGDALISVRYKQSAPDLEPRYDHNVSGVNEKYYGSNVSDGRHAGFTSGGGVAKTLRQPFGYRQGFKTAIGWIHEDLRPTDRARTSIMGSVGQYGWETKTATLMRAKTNGEYFLPLPGGYEKPVDSVPRGSQVPVIVAATSGGGIALPATYNEPTNLEYGQIGSINLPGAGPQVPDYQINPKIYWTLNANDPRRSLDPFEYPHVRYMQVLHRPTLYSRGEFTWLNDSDQPQPIWDKAQARIIGSFVANHTGGIGRPPDEKVPTHPQGETVAKPSLETLEPKPKPKPKPNGKKESKSTVR